MSKKSTPITATVVRKWAEDEGLIPAGQRGRLGTDVIKAWNARVSRGQRYPLTYERKPAPTVKVTAKAPGKAPVTRKVNLMDVRQRAAKAGVFSGTRGRIPQDVLQRAVLGEF